jgi:hypothetical protein
LDRWARDFISDQARPSHEVFGVVRGSESCRRNPFFQPPDAKTGAPLDVSEVKAIAFAPHDQTSGRLAIGKLVVSK